MNHRFLLLPAGVLCLIASGAALDLPKDADVGVYFSTGSTWIEAPVEIVNWQTGGVVKSFFTDGIIKGDINGRIQGGESKLALSGASMEIFIHTMEGVSAEEYQLIRLRQHSDAREFRSVTGGVFHVSGGAKRDVLSFSVDRVGPRLWRVTLPSGLRMGEYAFLPPVNTGSLAASGKVYSFSVGQCDDCSDTRARRTVAATYHHPRNAFDFN
jgi:hypothetical protein